ncbi:MAG: DUF2470 domain-containing protein [Mycobacterium sp.]|nr:DUF2470 domain-containing protein [Mycobacterium sp.]
MTTSQGDPRPSAAERVRTVCARAAAAQIAGCAGQSVAAPVRCPVQHLLADGSFVVTVPHRSALAGTERGTPVVVELLDRPPTAGQEAAQSLVWIRGTTRRPSVAETRSLLDAVAACNPHGALLDVGHRDTLLVVTVDSIVFADTSGAEHVDHAEVLAAQPDPFCHAEFAWVHHIQQHHPEMVERLRLHLPRRQRQGRIRLLGLDRYGLTVRTETPNGQPTGHRDARVPFHRPVADEAALSRALRALTACPFDNGLRPRSPG